MRLHCDRAQAAILRAVAAIALPLGARVVIEELIARDWVILTLAGTRHELDGRLDGPAAAAALAALLLTITSPYPASCWPNFWWSQARPTTMAWC